MGAAVCCGGLNFSPALGGGGTVLLFEGVGNEPPCGGGGPCDWLVDVGVGWEGAYCCADPVGAAGLAPG